MRGRKIYTPHVDYQSGHRSGIAYRGNGLGRAGYDSKNWERIQSFTTRYTTVHFNASGNPWWNDFMVVPRIYSRRFRRPSLAYGGRTFGLQGGRSRSIGGARRTARLNRNIDSRRSVGVPKFHYAVSFAQEPRASQSWNWKGMKGERKRGKIAAAKPRVTEHFSAQTTRVFTCPIKLHAILIQGARRTTLSCIATPVSGKCHRLGDAAGPESRQFQNSAAIRRHAPRGEHSALHLVWRIASV